ncbi:MAG: PIG-L deacetylase family protein [Anaerolineae bacterium]|jgi:LmbE family N-acetylglucosaminyl deacetylase|nr:PIG-L family deacetylase [Chloroflexota bacterium]
MTDGATAEQKRVLVIAAHPDDPEFGCAATMAKWAAEGQQVDYLLLTSGDQGNRDRMVHPSQIAARREVEQRNAADVLGVRNVTFLRYPDGMVENDMSLRRRLIRIIREERPHAVVTIDPWRPYQLHPDHRAAGFAALDAVRGSHAWHLFPEQLNGLEPWRVKEVFLFWTNNADYWEDVSDYMDLRCRSLRCHVSQVGPNPDGLEERVRQTARENGAERGMAYAEGFKRLVTG